MTTLSETTQTTTESTGFLATLSEFVPAMEDLVEGLPALATAVVMVATLAGMF